MYVRVIRIRKSLEDYFCMLSRCSHLFTDFRFFCFRSFVPVRVLFFSFNGNVRSKSGNKNSSKISLSRVTIERIPLSILFTLSIILKVAERLVRAGADVRRCRNAKRFKTNSEVFWCNRYKTDTHSKSVQNISDPALKAMDSKNLI